MPPPSLDKSIDKPAARPLTARSKRAPKPQVRAHDHPAEPPKSQADAPKSQVKATYNDSDEDIGSDDNIDYLKKRKESSWFEKMGANPLRFVKVLT